MLPHTAESGHSFSAITFLLRIDLTIPPAPSITLLKEMNKATDPVFKLVLSVGFGGLILIVFGILDRRDLLALAGSILVACALTSIARLVK